MKMPPLKKRPLIAIASLVTLGLLAYALAGRDDDAADAASAPRPTLSVTVETPLPMRISRQLSANGNIEAWQEAIIGANVSGLVLADVRVNVGDTVKRGQLLASFANQTVNADLEQAKARVAEAEAAAAEAEANAERARKVADSGALSQQQLTQYTTAAQTAQARFKAQQAAQNAQAVRLRDTQVLAPDDGIISARTATVGAVPAGPELFRLIRQGRLEWRAEIQAAQLALIKPGMNVTLRPTPGTHVEGKVRVIAPSIDPKTRNGIVYVDLPKGSTARAGMFAAGEFDVGVSDGLTLPQSAVMVRDGFSYVFKLGSANKVQQTKVEAGRRFEDRIEILTGLNADDRVVTAGGGFLSDGDTVRVVAAAAAEATDQAPARK